MERERFDITPLDPTRDPAMMERLVARIMAAAAPELERRASAGDVIYFLGRLSRPALAAAAMLAVLAGSVLARGDMGASPAQAAMTSVYVTADAASEEDLSLWEKVVLPPSQEDERLAVMDGAWE